MLTIPYLLSALVKSCDFSGSLIPLPHGDLRCSNASAQPIVNGLLHFLFPMQIGFGWLSASGAQERLDSPSHSDAEFQQVSTQEALE